jgi:hypothetical protein
LKPSKKQIGGNHYKNFKIQPFEFFVKNNIPFHKADIIKRTLRYNQPTGKGLEDLRKIKHEVDLILEFSNPGELGFMTRTIQPLTLSAIQEFLLQNKLDSDISSITYMILTYNDLILGKGRQDLDEIKKLVDKIIKREYLK